MKTVTNKTQKPVRVPLPRGKMLHLGPGRSGQIASNAADHPQLKKLVEAGEIEIVAEGYESTEGAGSETARRAWIAGRASGSRGRRGGDR